MRQLTANVLVETGVRGSNHGLVTTSDGLVLIDGPFKPSDTLRLRRRSSAAAGCATSQHEPHGDHWDVECVLRRARDRPRRCAQGPHPGHRPREHVARVRTFVPTSRSCSKAIAERARHPFEDEMTLHVGNHTFRMVHMPGHTAYQAAVIVEEEGVVFTSDNIFCRSHVLQEAILAVLQALDRLRRVGAETLVPGHGPVCDKSYLRAEAFHPRVGRLRCEAASTAGDEGSVRRDADRDDGSLSMDVEAGRLRTARHAHERRPTSTTT